MYVGQSVVKEVQQILRPFPMSKKLERRPKRTSKLKLAESKYGSSKTNKQHPTFQKKLIVMDYMGEKAPTNFTVKDCYIIIRGMLPEISVAAQEKEILAHVREVICSVKSYACCSENDFEFLEATGRCVCVPAKPSNFTWNAKAIKSLSGSGAVYVRLTVDPAFIGISSSSDEESEVKITRVDGKLVYLLY